MSILPIAPLFFLSGATALLYQVAFGRKLQTIFGATAYAVSAVLAAFMAGLAIGAHFGGRYASKVKRPLVLYGVAEVLVGVVCGVTPLLFDAVGDAYVGAVKALPSSLWLVSGLRMALAGACVLLPTAAMGVTLPMLARAFASEGASPSAAARSRRRLNLLYAINTAGGAAGALGAAYWVLPTLGLAATMRAAALVNAVIGVTAILLGLRGRAAEPGAASAEAPADPTEKVRAAPAVPAAARPLARRERRVHVGLAFASGLLVFAAEVVDTHLLTLLIGNSAYAFGLMLTAFLTCLTLGAALAGPVERRLGARALPVSLGLSAACVVVALPLWTLAPLTFGWFGKLAESWAAREAVRGLLAFGVLSIPTVAMGLTFPLLLRRVAGRADSGALVGRLTAVNTLGSIAGSLGTGYLILPALGSEWTLRAVALALVAAALAAAWASRGAEREARAAGERATLPEGADAAPSTRRRRLHLAGMIAAGAVGGTALALPGWNMAAMTNGANVYFAPNDPVDEILFVREDVHGGVTTVVRRGATRTLYTNGKFQGDNSGEVTAQRSFAHIPSLFVRAFGRVLVIGLGTGTTLGTITSYPYEHIEVAEISPSIVDAADTFFDGPNRRALHDPRVELHLNDGRNVLLLAQAPFDLVTIELTSVWFAGASNLYSREFYTLCKERLRPGGILQQWIQLHHIYRADLAAVLRTLRGLFADVALFVSGGQGILVASDEPLVASRSRLVALGARPDVHETLGGYTLESLLDRLALSGPELDRFIADSAAEDARGELVSTDDNLYLEYATPNGNVMDYSVSIRKMIDTVWAYRPADVHGRHLAP
ncbi:MAG: fused MFS/spermidine synthase [Polyangiaceae bacterium]|nr:fused MFS/spermidine synthase [Polyangiaceae bacterium]